VGDLITTEKPIDRDVLMQVEGRNKFVGQVGQLRGSKSVRITRICNDVAGEQAVARADARVEMRNEAKAAAAGGRG